jgi:hypothetical protein
MKTHLAYNILYKGVGLIADKWMVSDQAETQPTSKK